MSKKEFGDFSTAYPVLRALDAKGLTWWEDGRVTLLPERALEAIGSAESNASGTPSWDAVAPRAKAARAAAASAIEARRAATLGAVHESAVGDSRDAPTSSPTPPEVSV